MTGAYAGGRPNPRTSVEGGLQCLHGYSVPNARLESFLVYTNLVPGGNMRAPGEVHCGFAGESHIDHIAHELGMDPLEFRLRNVIRESDTGLRGERFRNPKAVEVLERLRVETNWGSGALGPNRGRGVAMRARHVGAGKTQLLLRLLPSAQVEVLSGAADQGGGAATMTRRVVAAALSVDPARVTVRYGTTAEAPEGAGVGGSRTTHVVGQAAPLGAEELKRQIETRAAEAMDWPGERLQLAHDRFWLDSSVTDSVAFEEVAERILRVGPLEVLGVYDSASLREAEGGDYNFYAYMIEVEVDPETGQVRPIDVVGLVDSGTIINPIAYEGQLEGGFVYGLGQATTEELLFDEDGRVTNVNLGEYKLPVMPDIPPLRWVVLPTPIGPGPFGAKSAGETANTAVTGAIANAVYDAVGVRVTHMPITAERVYAVLHGAD